MANALQLDQYYNYQQDVQNKESNCYLDHMCDLDIDTQPKQIRATSIICTIGKYFSINLP